MGFKIIVLRIAMTDAEEGWVHRRCRPVLAVTEDKDDNDDNNGGP